MSADKCCILIFAFGPILCTYIFIVIRRGSFTWSYGYKNKIHNFNKCAYICRRRWMYKSQQYIIANPSSTKIAYLDSILFSTVPQHDEDEPSQKCCLTNKRYTRDFACFPTKKFSGIWKISGASCVYK